MLEFRVNATGLSDTGKVRAVNEDSLLQRDGEGLWAVADGMGGHAHGKWASQAVVAALEGADLGGDFEACVQAVGGAILAANRTVLDESVRIGAQMGSTVVALLLCQQRFALLWAGDSRAYLRRGSELVRLTTDHTYVEDLIAAGQLTPEEAATHPRRHVLSRAVGVEADLALDAVTDEIRALDLFLLCSDGLTGLLSDAEINHCLNRNSTDAAVRLLMETALERGAPDNVTVVVVRCDEITRVSLSEPELANG